jgi:hypothetical protein
MKAAAVAPAAVNRKKNMDHAQRENLRLLSSLQVRVAPKGAQVPRLVT